MERQFAPIFTNRLALIISCLTELFGEQRVASLRFFKQLMLTEVPVQQPFTAVAAWLGAVLDRAVAGVASRLRWPSASSIVRW